MQLVLKSVFALLLAATVGFAQQEPQITVKIGQPAPPLVGGKWLKGDPIDRFESGKIYVVEFWATWCGPCMEAIPHITQLQKDYASQGVTIIGQNVSERNPAAPEPFVAEMGDKMGYHIRLDDVPAPGHGRMAVTWLRAAGQRGIPCSFVIGKDGNIAWIGDPMDLEPVLKQELAGTFDRKKAAADEDARQELNRKLNQAMQAGNVDQALADLTQFEKTNPDLADEFAGARFDFLLQKKDYDNAYKAAIAYAEATDNHPAVLNKLAWVIATAEGIEKRDLDLAEKFATTAAEKSARKNASVLDTLARIQFDRGQIDKAIATEAEAIAVAKNDEMKAELTEVLEKYKAGKK